MKKFAAGVATAAALSLTFAGAGIGSAQAYGPNTPQHVNQIVKHKGKIAHAKAKKLKREVRAAKKAGLISPKRAAKLIKKINKDTRRKHHNHR